MTGTTNGVKTFLSYLCRWVSSGGARVTDQRACTRVLRMMCNNNNNNNNYNIVVHPTPGGGLSTLMINRAGHRRPRETNVCGFFVVFFAPGNRKKPGDPITIVEHDVFDTFSGSFFNGQHPFLPQSIGQRTLRYEISAFLYGARLRFNWNDSVQDDHVRRHLS